MTFKETSDTLEKTWWGRDLQTWNMGEQFDVICEGRSKTWTSGVIQVCVLPEPSLVPPHLADLYSEAAKTKGLLNQPGSRLLSPAPQ